ncbi:MAG: choice-of-anchor J domain-containing protein [Muribaculaceae bacterium]
MKKTLPIYRGCVLAAIAVMCSSVSLSAEDALYYSSDFACANLSDIGFTTIDGNADGKTWTPRQSTLNYYYIDGVKYSDPTQYTPTMIESKSNDDWLITPGIALEAGKTYRVKFSMCKNWFVAEQNVFEICLGTAKNAASMTRTLIPVSTLPQGPGNNIFNFETTIQVDSDADYYIGIHATGPSTNGFGIARLELQKGVAISNPLPVDNLTITPDASGVKKAVLSFNAPLKAKDGSDLAALTQIEIRRNGEYEGRIDNPTPGAALTYTSQVAVNGIYTYTVIPYSASGAGDAASVTTFIGINTPTAATDVVVVSTGNTASHITWTAPTLDKDGYPVIASTLKYDLYRRDSYSSDWENVASDLTANSFDDNVTREDDAQAFYTYGVVAKTNEGEAKRAESNPLPMGTPYPMPFKESFVGGRASTIATSTEIGGHTQWLQTIDFETVKAADGDNGMIYLNGALNGAADLHLGLVDITSQSPVLTYYTYNITDPAPASTLKVIVTATDGTQKVFDEYTPGNLWHKSILRLDEFVGKTVMLDFIGKRLSMNDMLLDDINISEIFRQDLKVNGITVPDEARSGEDFQVTVDVLNFGSDLSGDYSVDLYCDGQKVDSRSASGLGVGDHNMITFTCNHGIFSPDKVSYSAAIVYDADEYADNNTSESVEIPVLKNSYPVVDDLSGTLSGNTVTLTWSEPDTSKAQPYPVKENFDSYTSWANSGIGEWVLVDRDQAQIAGFSDGDMPGIPDYSQQSWWIFDNSDPQFNNGSMATLSGHKFLASMVSGIKGEGYVQNDDWAISPELYGGPQTITINARSYSLSDLETFEVLYSTGSVNPDDFVNVEEFPEIPAQYTAYEVELPDGAKRFAIRNISLGKYLLMVDDITYIPVGEPGAFSINGYNIYRDGVKLNSAPVEENEFTDSDCTDPNHNYHVTVLYSAGESRASNTYSPSGAAVTETETSTFRAFGADGTILLRDATEAVTVYTVDGRTAAQLPAGSDYYATAPGLYIVVSGTTAVKVLVK